MTFGKKIKELGKRVIDGFGKDRLIPLDRIQKLRRFEESNRVTGSLSFWTPSAVGIKNISTRDYFTNPEIMYYCQLVALNTFNHDFPLLSSDNDTPLITEPPIKQKADLNRCRMPDLRRVEPEPLHFLL